MSRPFSLSYPDCVRVDSVEGLRLEIRIGISFLQLVRHVLVVLALDTSNIFTKSFLS